ncbi:hypothetical protein [Cellulomonas biazotea]|uniref:Uncharacterized protein n=1 Tax=Cellulomonas biazotea TaxID=1709 RepID=A0A402DU41_9CELL|nr:hypothetical protein [Cellulomonas biazotea]GCE77618.1 hypothetical protein CBZ_26740 [Cellulomonas biazotea]
MTPRDWRRKRRLLLNAAVVLVVGLAVLRVATRGSTVIAVAAVLALAGGAWLAVDTVRRRRAGREHDAGGHRDDRRGDRRTWRRPRASRRVG